MLNFLLGQVLRDNLVKLLDWQDKEFAVRLGSQSIDCPDVFREQGRSLEVVTLPFSIDDIVILGQLSYAAAEKV